MSKRPKGTQIEMLLPISGKRAEPIPVVKKTRALSYEKIFASLQKKGLTMTAVKK